MRRLLCLIGLVLLVSLTPARSEDLSLPGLQRDAQAYAHSLRQRFPAGATSGQRAQAERTARDALATQDWAGAAQALSERLGQGETNAALWLALAQALLHQPRPDVPHALAAAWQSYSATETAADKVAALRVMRDALVLLKRPVEEVEVLEQASLLAPDDADLKRELATREQEFGLLVRKVRTEPESFPARACVAFIGRPGGSADFHPGDWVTLTPPIKAAAVTLELDQICITGLQPGTRTQISFAQGMPGADGMSLKQSVTLGVAMPDRRPRLVFSADRFLQPGGTPAAVSLASVNLSKVKLHLLRVSERAMQPFLASHPLGSDDFDLASLRDSAREVWTGSADIPGFTRNALLHTVLPLPSAIDQPGLYVLLAQPDDGTPSGGASPQAVQTLLRTDLAPTIWRGDDGLTVQVRGYASEAPKPACGSRWWRRTTTSSRRKQPVRTGWRASSPPCCTARTPSRPRPCI